MMNIQCVKLRHTPDILENLWSGNQELDLDLIRIGRNGTELESLKLLSQNPNSIMWIWFDLSNIQTLNIPHRIIMNYLRSEILLF